MKTGAKGRRGTGVAPVAVVYSDDSTGPADGDDAGALVGLLRGNARWNFQVRTVGPNGVMTVQEALAAPEVRLYAQPGADGDDRRAYKRQKGDKAAIREFVRGGGRYLGICMGGFLAEPGRFNIFRGRVEEYYSSPGAAVTTADPALLSVTWRGTPRQLYFQDGGYMVPQRQAVGVTVLARYPNNTIAAIVASFGTGRSVCRARTRRRHPSGIATAVSPTPAPPRISVMISSTP